jgi:hypothetical protein
MRALDLFRTTAQGTEWVATFSDIDLTKEELRQIVLETPGEYFLLDQISGEKVVFERNQERPARRVGLRLG